MHELNNGLHKTRLFLYESMWLVRCLQTTTRPGKEKEGHYGGESAAARRAQVKATGEAERIGWKTTADVIFQVVCPFDHSAILQCILVVFLYTLAQAALLAA